MKLFQYCSRLSSFALTTFVTLTCFAQQSNALADGPQQVAGAVAGQPQAPAWINFVLIGGIVLFMWLFVIRPQSKRAKEQKQFLDSLKPGIEVVTSGGLIGTIAEVKENIVSLNVGNNSTIRVLKSSISGNIASAAQMPVQK